MNQPLTIVLPMHNRERQIRSSILDLLDATVTVSQPLRIVVVDDGSTDDTFEAACELQRQYPQVIVLRQSIQQGMGAALELVRNRLAAEHVLVHDGISAIDSSHLQMAILSSQGPRTASPRVTSPATESSGSRRFAAVRSLHEQMAEAHRSTTCFKWIQLEKPIVPRRRSPIIATALAGDMRVPTMPAPIMNPTMGINS